MQMRWMFVRRFTAVFALVLATTLMLSCSNGTPAELETKTQQSIKNLYRSSSLIIVGVIEDSYFDETNRQYSTVKIEQPFSDTSLDTITVLGGDGLEKNSRYIMFLIDADYLPLGTYIQLQAYKLNDEFFVIDGASVSLDSAISFINALSFEVLLPLHTYYYYELPELVNKCDEIFIGRIEKFPQLSTAKCYSEGTSVNVENETEVSRVEVKVLGTIKGDESYGSRVELMYVPEMVSGMLDGSTLAPVSFPASSIPPLDEGDIYMFFLIENGDAKRDYMLAINPIQGCVRIDREKLIISQSNECLLTYTTLSQLVSSINNYLNKNNG